MRQLFRFMFHHASHLTFGAMLMAMSSFGQTYFVSLYGQDFREAFGLTDGGLGGLYAIGTVMSAITLTWAGRLIDYTTTRRFTLAVTLLLLTACLLVSGAQAAWMLCIGFYFLRLGGQGLMVHTALTATARQFPLDAGKALGAIALGLSLAQADCGADKRADGMARCLGHQCRNACCRRGGRADVFAPREREAAAYVQKAG